MEVILVKFRVCEAYGQTQRILRIVGRNCGRSLGIGYSWELYKFMPTFTRDIKTRVSVPRDEYMRLKKIESRFRDFWAYMERIAEIGESRNQIKQKKVISQEQLFKRLGF